MKVGLHEVDVIWDEKKIMKYCPYLTRSRAIENVGMNSVKEGGVERRVNELVLHNPSIMIEIRLAVDNGWRH